MSCTQIVSPARRRGHQLVPFAGTERRWRQTAIAHLRHRLALWFARSRQRRDLAELDAHLLKDIGVTPGQAAREAAKPFWVE
jgi:uncharacterized protein YjiS (DUF1127 family)